MGATRRNGPPAGVRVVELSEIIAAPFGGMLLSDMGADVIKIEPPTGDPWRDAQPLGLREGRGFISLNRGKRGITLDLTTSDGRAIVQELADRADVFLINFRPDVAEKLGVDYDTLSSRNPRLIYCDNTAFGRKGPDAHRPGYDLIAQAVTGLMSVEGRRDENGVPMVNALPSADISTGLAIAWSICGALYSRERTGQGQYISTTLMSSALAIQNTRLMSIEAVDSERREAAMARVNELRRQGGTYKEQLDALTGIRPALGNIYYRCFATADGFIAIGCLAMPLRRKLLTATGLEDWRVGKRPEEIDYGNAEVQQHCKALVVEAEALFRTKTTSEWLTTMDSNGVPAGDVKFTEELLDDPQVLANDFVTTLEHSFLGPVRMAGPMVQMSATPLEATACSPTLGQHTVEVLQELGYDEARISNLRQGGVLGDLAPPGGVGPAG